MTLFNCLSCAYIDSLLQNETTVYPCGASRGRYLHGGLVALVCGPYVRVLGIANTRYIDSLTAPVEPYHSAYEWFPILPERQHHVMLVQSVEQLEAAIAQGMRSYRHAVRCLSCNAVIESLSNHNSVTCPCGKVSVDGGGQGGSRRIVGERSGVQVVVE